MDTGRRIVISGPLPTYRRGAERWSRLFNLHTWLRATCAYSDINFVNNFNLFWERPGLLKHDGLHPNRIGASLLSDNMRTTLRHCSILCCRSISFDDFASFEYHAIVLKCQPPALTVTVYRPPKQYPTFLTDFSELLSIIHTNYDKISITGDFNIHVDNGNDSKARDFMNLLNSMDFTQHITEPTHNRGHTLDLVITKGLTTVISSICDLFLTTFVFSLQHWYLKLEIVLNVLLRNAILTLQQLRISK